ncbi:hypothetical protein BKA70DRAFT_1440530 [Coprinopsis sp. MPI-PUGE-AT-0042]|nr:hypothetical protein BKA70DRAFT_1440530 [Coprinopsis sp. MPI-PUGE-AT-0042]
MASTNDDRVFTLEYLREVTADLVDPRGARLRGRAPPQQAVPQAVASDSLSSRFSHSTTSVRSLSFPSVQIQGPSEDGHLRHLLSMMQHCVCISSIKVAPFRPVTAYVDLIANRSTAQSSQVRRTPSMGGKHLPSLYTDGGWFGDRGDGQLEPQPVYYPNRGGQTSTHHLGGISASRQSVIDFSYQPKPLWQPAASQKRSNASSRQPTAGASSTNPDTAPRAAWLTHPTIRAIRKVGRASTSQVSLHNFASERSHQDQAPPSDFPTICPVMKNGCPRLYPSGQRRDTSHLHGV